MRRTYTRDDVQTHTRGYAGERLPAVDVKVRTTIDDAYPAFARDEKPDPRFTLEWIAEHVADETLGDIFWASCEWEYEYLDSWASRDEDRLFPDDAVTLSREGRSGGWVVVSGLPDLDEWDAVRLARWRRFERIARDIAAGVPYQVLGSIYANEFEGWSEDEDDAATYNAEVPIDLAPACTG